MSSTAGFFLLIAIEVGGLFAIWFLIKAKVRRYLELENLLSGVREEARALVLELNETADRNVSLVEDKMIALRELLDEVDRRMGLSRRELETRVNEREVYAKLSRRRPIVPSAEPPMERPPALSPPALPGGEGPAKAQVEAPIQLNLGPEAQEANRSGPEVRVSEESIVPSKTKREEALDLFRRGISADLIAAKLGVTVAEIELLIEIEESRRSSSEGIL